MATNPDIEAHVPPEVTEFLEELNTAVEAGDASRTHSLYDIKLNQLTGKYFSRYTQKNMPFRPWPRLQHVEDIFTDENVKVLYSFIHFRSAFLDRNIRAAAARDSWVTFSALLKLLATPDSFVDLPNAMLWDIFDEFLYELSQVHIRGFELEGAWNVQEAIALLEQIVSTSNLYAQLRAVEQNDMYADQFNGSGAGHLLRVAGFYAHISLMRMDLLLGDYYGVLKRCGTLVANQFTRNLTRRVPIVHVPLYYTIGFAHMMMRRYVDAVKMLRNGLSVHVKHRNYVDQMQAHIVMLMNMCNTLGNLPSGDLLSYVNDANKGIVEEDMQLLPQGDTERFREVFLRAAPKFITIRPPAGSSSGGGSGGGAIEQSASEARELQERIFMREVSQQLDNIKLRGYFRVYSAMTAEKAGALLHPENPSEFEVSSLLSVKHKSRQLVNGRSEPALTGNFSSIASTDFYVVDGSVNIVSRKEATRLPITHDLVQRVATLNDRINAKGDGHGHGHGHGHGQGFGFGQGFGQGFGRGGFRKDGGRKNFAS